MFVCCLAARLFDSPAALYLFVSARICPPPSPSLPEPPFPTSCFAQTPFTPSRLPHLGFGHKDMATHRPKQEVLLVPFFSACAVCVPHREFSYPLSMASAMERTKLFGEPLPWWFCISVSNFLHRISNLRICIIISSFHPLISE